MWPELRTQRNSRGWYMEWVGSKSGTTEEHFACRPVGFGLHLKYSRESLRSPVPRSCLSSTNKWSAGEEARDCAGGSFSRVGACPGPSSGRCGVGFGDTEREKRPRTVSASPMGRKACRRRECCWLCCAWWRKERGGRHRTWVQTPGNTPPLSRPKRPRPPCLPRSPPPNSCAQTWTDTGRCRLTWPRSQPCPAGRRQPPPDPAAQTPGHKPLPV